MPPEPARQLADAARLLGLDLRDETLAKLIGYLALLERWNRVYNLTAVREPGEMLTRHLLDCLAVLPALVRHAAGRPLRILDVGSGAGLPGVVLALVQADWDVSCVDAVAKKATFIRQAGAEFSLGNLHALHARIEVMKVPQGGFDVIASRAFSSLADLVTLTRRHLAPEGVWMAMKGKRPDEELLALPPDICVFHVEPLQLPGLDAQRCLIWLRPAL